MRLLDSKISLADKSLFREKISLIPVQPGEKMVAAFAEDEYNNIVVNILASNTERENLLVDAAAQTAINCGIPEEYYRFHIIDPDGENPST